MRSIESVIIAFGLASALAACADKTPANVKFGPINTMYSSKDEASLVATVTNKSGEALPDVHAAFKVSSDDVAVITQAGALKCIKSGDVTVTATAGTLTHDEHVSCRIVHAVKAPATLRLTIPNDPVAPVISVVNAAGHPMTEVTPTIAIADTTIATAEGLKLRPVSVGTTDAIVSAGDKSATIKVTVAKNLKNEPLLLNDGARINQPLTQGNYELRIHLKAGSGVTVTWVGGTDCRNLPESGPEIVSSCRIGDTGSVIIENPAGPSHVEGWLFKEVVKTTSPPADGNITLVQIP